MKLLNKTMSAAVLGAAALLISSSAFADTKIATIRIDDVVQQSPQYKALNDKMKAEFDRRKNDLVADGKKFQADVEKYKKDGELMSAADRLKTEKDLASRQADLQYKEHQFQDDAQARQSQLAADMTNQLKTVIEQVAKEKGFDAVLPNPIYASASVDITDIVIKRLAPAQ